MLIDNYIRSNDFKLFKQYIKHGNKIYFSPIHLICCVRFNRLHFIKYMYYKKIFDESDFFKAAMDAAKLNRLNILMFFYKVNVFSSESLCSRFIFEAALNGLQQRQRQGIECIEFLSDIKCNPGTCRPWAICSEFVFDVKLLQRFHLNGYTWSKTTCNFAAAQGNLESLKYAYYNECNWDSDVYMMTIDDWNSENYLETIDEDKYKCFRFAFENYCPLPKNKTFTNTLPGSLMHKKFNIYMNRIAEEKATENLQLYKEELIAKTWHPSRFFDWCLDEDEKETIQEDFNV